MSINPVTTAATPEGDILGEPEELEAYVESLEERGEPVPPELARALAAWRENNA